MKKKHKKSGDHRSPHETYIKVAVWLVATISSLYAYQYFMRPEINIKDIRARYLRITNQDDARIEISLKNKNDGNSKTKNIELYSVFPKWEVQQNKVTVTPYDFVYSDVPDLMGGGEATTEFFKDIKADDFIEANQSAEGIYLILVLRWKSDNVVFWGRTFENHGLFFLRPGMKDNRIVFEIKGLSQKYITKWFSNSSEKPNIFSVIEGLHAKQLIFGDTSRFD